MIDTATLQARLSQAESALHKLLTGTAVVEVEDRNGQRTRFAQGNVMQLRAYIAELKQQIDPTSTSRRSPMCVRF